MNKNEIREHDSKTDYETVRVELWTRRPVCGPRTAVIDRLSALSASGAVDDYEIRTWPESVSLSEHSEHAQVVEAYRAFEQWATSSGVSLSASFERHTTTSLVGRTEDVLRVPMLCLAVYHDDELQGVYPCSDEDRTWSVDDYLDAYEAAGRPPGDGAVPAVE